MWMMNGEICVFLGSTYPNRLGEVHRKRGNTRPKARDTLNRTEVHSRIHTHLVMHQFTQSGRPREKPQRKCAAMKMLLFGFAYTNMRAK